MSLHGFDALFADADARRPRVPVAVAGGDDPTVARALREATDRGWIAPFVVGPAAAVRAAAGEAGVGLEGFELVDAPAELVAATAVGLVLAGRAAVLVKGRVNTPSLMRAVLDPTDGLRTGRVIGQFVLMEIPRDGRRFVMTDTGVSVRPSVDQRADLLRSAVALAQALGEPRPRVAVLAASESVSPSMPETVDASALQARAAAGEFPGCEVQGPLSFDLAYAPGPAGVKRVGGPVAGAADVLLFPDLVSANLTVKAVMYTADCRFGGVLRGTSAPVAFMSRADDAPTRVRSLALALRVLERGG